MTSTLPRDFRGDPQPWDEGSAGDNPLARHDVINQHDVAYPVDNPVAPRRLASALPLGHVAAAFSAMVTLILLFQPWVSASGPNGQLRSDAFGRVSGVAATDNRWMDGGDQSESISVSGTWGVLAALAAVVTIGAVVMNIRLRTAAFAFVVTGASVLMAVFVMAALMYLSDKAPELRLLTEADRGLVGGIGNLLRSVLGGGGSQTVQPVASAGLETAGMICGAVAFTGAVAAVASGVRSGVLRTGWLDRMRVPQPPQA